MELFLSPSIFLAVRAEDLLLLDASVGEYLLLPDAGDGVAVAPDSNRVSVGSATLAEALASLGAFAPQALPIDRRPIPPPPTCDLGGELGPPSAAADRLRMLLTSADMVRGYWRAPFGKLVAKELAAPVMASDIDRLASASQTFRRLLPWVPFQGECLFRSLMLRAYLRRLGLSATWVVGCQTWPFEAHCWLQSGVVVLDDTAEHAASFTPLMAV